MKLPLKFFHKIRIMRQKVSPHATGKQYRSSTEGWRRIDFAVGESLGTVHSHDSGGDMRRFLGSIAGMLSLSLLIAATGHGAALKQVYLKDGGIIECQSFFKKDGNGGCCDQPRRQFLTFLLTRY